ncbi:MAG: preprotein translocase subunit SecE [Thermoleophilia bacterium]|nr:preprotein translocase subunit SecE [Thermoleophilia bacterium]
MARQTRQQRRQRRAQQQAAVAASPRPLARRAEAREARSEPRRPARREERHAPGLGPIRFVQEAIAELKKVEWPDQKAVISGTAVVLIACVIVGAYLWANDRVWQYVVQHVLLR